MQIQPQGIFCALWTPLDSKGEVIWEHLQRHLEFVLDSGVHGLMALGSTANFPYLSLDKRKKILETVSVTCREREIPVIINVSDVSFRNVIELAEHAQSCAVSAMAVLPPWYYGVEQTDLAEFFIEVGRRVTLPLALYNYPEMTGKKIELETIKKVGSTIPLFGFKQSGADFDYHHSLMEIARTYKFGLYTGADTRLPEAAKLGASGSISGLANATPDVLARIWNKTKEGIYESEDSATMTQLSRFMSEIPYTLNVKAALQARGFETGESPNPLSKETLQKYNNLVARLEEFYAVRGLKTFK